MPTFLTKAKNLFLALIAAASLSGCTLTKSDEAAALQITTTPETSVFLDGKHVGKTPFYSDQLRGQEYQIKLASGEATYTEKITLTPGTLTVLTRELNNNFLAQSGEVLRLEPQGKGIFVVSMPAEADLALDGRFLGQTPYYIKEVNEGEHKITLTKPGYLEREFTVKTSNDYKLIADVTLASNIAKSSTNVPPVQLQEEVIVIQESPQGFQRVRREASSTSAEVGRVNEGDELEVIQETQDWVQVRFEDRVTKTEKQGWVDKDFTKKLLPGT